MGLTIEVGMLSNLVQGDKKRFNLYKEEFAKLNHYLISIGLPEHKEPEEVPGTDYFLCEMWGYSGLHYLRRIAVHSAYGKSLPEPGDEKTYNKDTLVDAYYKDVTRTNSSLLSRLFRVKPSLNLPFQHLMLHSDSEGYYLPIDFPNVLFTPKSSNIPGVMIGSSQQLLSECNILAKLLEIPADLDPESKVVFEIADNQGTGEIRWQKYGIETFTCIRLIGACHASIKTGAAIVFC